MTRYGYSCARCAEWYFSETREDKIALTCPICSGELKLRGKVGADSRVRHQEERLACGAMCQTAIGVWCDCGCGGVNHGRIRTVTVTVTDGVARLSLDDPAAMPKLQKLAAKRLPMIEEAERRAKDLEKALTAESVWRRRCEGAWLGPTDWQRFRDVDYLLGEVWRSRKLKLPSARLRKLDKVEQEYAAMR